VHGWKWLWPVLKDYAKPQKPYNDGSSSMGFLQMLYDIQKHLPLGIFVLSNMQVKHSISEASSASVFRWWGSRNAPSLVGPVIEGHLN
jgi:hypothetical protein